MEALGFLRLLRKADSEAARDPVENNVSPETCCPLPFFLQDLCLLVIINDLDSYPTELLAALPYWLRYRILNNIPALSLSRLELTSVTSGIDIDSIWKSRLTGTGKTDTQARSPLSQLRKSNDDDEKSTSKGSPFQLNISRDRHLFSSTSSLPYSCHIPGSNDLMKDIIKDLNDVKDCELSSGNRHLLEIASALFTTSYGTDLEKVIHQLVSIQGNVVLSNLLTGSMHQNCKNPLCNQEVWKRQGTALTVKELNTNSYRYYSYNTDNRRQLCDIQLTPRCLLPLCDKCNPVELLSLLSKNRQVRPHGVNICIDAFSQSCLPSLCAERLALDGNLGPPTVDSKYTSIVNLFLENVVSLRLQCGKYSQIGLVVSMIKAAIANDQSSNLKHLICAIPDLYMDIMEPLCSLFLLPNFHLLTLDLSEVYPLMLSKLLRVFLTAPCPHVHKLMIHVKRGLQFQMTLKESQVAALDMKGMTIPPCSLQHKILKFSSNDDFTRGLYLLLQFPAIRLRVLTLFTSNEYFHLCAIHPDLQTTKLVITIVENVASHRERPQHLATLQQDLVSLFKISSLQKISIHGIWGQLTEVKLGLVFGLQNRSRLLPLKKLSLELESQHSYKIRDFQMLCDAIFSLPELDNLKLVLGKGFADMIRQRRYEDAMYRSWSQKGAGVKLKSISLHTNEAKLKQVQLITHNISFSGRPATRASSYYHDYDYDYDSDNDYAYEFFGDSYDDDLYYGHSPWPLYDYDDCY